jgi:hypothetical protein
MWTRKISRRGLGKFAALILVSRAEAEEDPLAIRDLNLPLDLRQSLEPRVQQARKEARFLEELPLDGVDPGFVFHAR